MRGWRTDNDRRWRLSSGCNARNPLLVPRYRALVKPIVKSALICTAIILFIVYVRREFVPDDFEAEPIRLIRPWGIDVNSAAIFKNVIKYYSMTDASKSCERKRIVISVISAPADQEYRDYARKSWIKDLPSYVAYQFLIGAVTDSNLEEILFKEQAVYHDIIRYNLSDSYHRLVIKSYIAFDWTLKFCDDFTHFVKIDVDVYPNIPAILKTIEQRIPAEKKLLFGETRIGTPVLRWPNKNYILSRDIREDIVPVFSRGAMYIYTREAVKSLLENAKKISVFRAEDVYFNGIVSEVAGIERVHSDKFCVNLAEDKNIEDGLTYCELTPTQLMEYHLRITGNRI
uniref:Hexosyltransferase n=1 Tax=Bursaphelenchus xylophilus TaxID=6326 RepID=A0A1I7S4M1_BURXY